MASIKSVSLRTKIIGMVMLVTTILSISSYINMMKFSEDYKISLNKTIQEYASMLGESIKAQFFERYGDIQAFAIHSTVQSLDENKLPALLTQYVDLYGIYDLIVVVDKEGKFVGSNLRDIAGTTVDQKSLKAYDFKNAPWFKSVISGKFSDDKTNGFAGTYFEDFQADPLVGAAFGNSKFGSGFSAAIKDSAGNIVGVITNRAGKRWIEDQIPVVTDALAGKGYGEFEVYIANTDGVLISSTSKLGSKSKLESVDDPNIILKQNYLSTYIVPEKTLKANSDYFQAGHEGSSEVDIVGYYKIQGKKWVDAFAWKIFVQLPESIAYAHVDEANRNFYIIFFITTFLAITFAIWFGVLISKSIADVTRTLSQNSTEVSDASNKIASSATELSEAATEQAAALQETVAAVDEISAMVDKNAEAANKSKDMSAQSRQAAEKGRQIVEGMLSAIDNIDQSNDEVSNQMESSNRELAEITKLIKDIGNKTKVINEIVFQTKLLSFNASVEAARAGEYGKGFAVVAEEVGNLAQMSGNAAKEITSLLDESVQKVESIVNETKNKVERLMESSKDKVRHGTQTAKECSEALDEIIINVQNVDSLVSEIAVSSSEQSTGIREISKAVGQMEQVTQQNTSVANSSSVSAEQLRSQSATLNSIVNDLTRIVTGQDQGANFLEHQNKKQDSKSVEKNERRVIAMNPNQKNDYSSEVRHKKASGGESIPSSDDPGFAE